MYQLEYLSDLELKKLGSTLTIDVPDELLNELLEELLRRVIIKPDNFQK